jgi:hypothetical protein
MLAGVLTHTVLAGHAGSACLAEFDDDVIRLLNGRARHGLNPDDPSKNRSKSQSQNKHPFCFSPVQAAREPNSWRTTLVIGSDETIRPVWSPPQLSFSAMVIQLLARLLQPAYAFSGEEVPMSERVREFMYQAAIITGGTAPVALLALALLLN